MNVNSARVPGEKFVIRIMFVSPLRCWEESRNEGVADSNCGEQSSNDIQGDSQVGNVTHRPVPSVMGTALNH